MADSLENWQLPSGVRLTALDPDFREDPYAVLAELRRRAPTHFDSELVRLVVTDHDRVHDVLRHKEMWSDPRKGNPDSFSQFLLPPEGEEPSMLLMDDPDHKRLRSLVSGSFTPRAVEAWRPRIRAVVAKVLAGLEGGEFDLIADFSGPVPTVVIAEMLGIDPAMQNDFKRWSDTSVKVAFNPFPGEEEKARAVLARQALNEFFRAEIGRRRLAPGEDLISDMLRAEEAGERLSEKEIVTQCNLLLIAGNVTTTDLIGNGVKALLENPDQLRKLMSDPGLLENAVEDMLRFDSPVVTSGRIVHQDMDIDGCPVHRGASVTVSLAAANHDPKVYPDPERFDIERADTHHHAFGGGRHHCLGAPLARVEAQEAIAGLFRKFPDLRPSERGHTYAAVPSFRGMQSFWVRA